MKLSRFILKIVATLVLLVLILVIFVRLRTPEIKLSKSIPDIDKTREARVISAFFGIDNSLPLRAIFLYPKAPGKDGMPVVFSQEVDPSTLDNSDFEVLTENGKMLKVEYVTLNPANEEFELRTVLLIGEVGNHPENPPVSVKIVGDLKSRSGQNYKGQSVGVTPLPEGPFISYAEYFFFDEDYPYVEKGRGCDCPREETQMVVRTVWSGGVRAVDGNELGLNEIHDFEVTMVQGPDTLKVKPFQFGDLNDNDNNVDLCLKKSGIPIDVQVKENVTMDPRDDKNPETKAKILNRW